MEQADISLLSTLIQNMESSVVSDFGIPQGRESPEDETTKKEEVKVKLGPLRRSRGAVKRKITLLIKQLIEIVKEGDHLMVSPKLEDIKLQILEVKKYDEQIEAVICASGILDYSSSLLDEEMIASTDYHLQHQKAMKMFHLSEKSLSRHSSIHSESSLGESNPQQNEIHSMLKTLTTKQEVKIPPLKCKSFSGEADRLQFRSFLLSFENIIGSRRDLTEAAKLQYLKSHLTGMAQKDVDHLPNIDSNYEVALKILKDLYLDKPFIIDSLFHRIYAAPSLDGKNLESVRSFMSELRAHLHELKEFGVDLLEEGSAGCKFLSHILADKLPKNFLREFKIVHKEEYPSVISIIDHYHVIIKSMERLREAKTFSSSSLSKKKSSSSNSKQRKSSIFHSSTSSSSSKQYSKQERTAPSKNFPISKGSFSELKCKLCEGAHSMSSCPKYTTPSSRRERCNNLGLCACCSSTKHKTSSCPAKQYGLSHPCALCKSKTHITPLCCSGVKSQSKESKKETEPSASSSSATSAVEDDSFYNHLCINAGASASENILPTLSLKIRRGDRTFLIRCMADNGSQQTYCRSSVLEMLGVDINSLPRQTTNIKTFLGEQSRSMFSINLEINLCCNLYFSVPVLIDPDLNIGFEVKGLMGAEYNIRHNGFHIADRFYYKGIHEDVVSQIDCLLGNDVLYLIKHFKVVNCIRGSAFETCHGYIPFGPVRSFLTPSQIETIFNKDPTSHEERSS